jgi:tRNA nucleotidyltransferase (CCA-adding enzyme)
MLHRRWLGAGQGEIQCSSSLPRDLTMTWLIKLLGLESNDIDIALSSMMGFPFATKFAEYLKTRGISATQVTKVESRAEQSKHLETAKLSLLGVDLDFVNLRSEEYAEESRIPTRVVSL